MILKAAVLKQKKHGNFGNKKVLVPTKAKCNAGLVGLWNVFRDASAKTSFDELYLIK
jgi:hypothetical protein